MDFPAFSSICSSNKAECDVNAVWILCECQSFFCSSCRFVRGILCRWEDEESKGQRDKGTKSQKDKGSKRRRDKKKKGQRDKGSKRRREEETKGREDENRVTSYSPPIHLLFVSSSLPLHSPIRSILIQFVSKNIREIRVSKQHTKEHRFVRVR